MTNNTERARRPLSSETTTRWERKVGEWHVWMTAWTCGCPSTRVADQPSCDLCGYLRPPVEPLPRVWHCGDCGHENGAMVVVCGKCDGPRRGAALVERVDDAADGWSTDPIPKGGAGAQVECEERVSDGVLCRIYEWRELGGFQMWWSDDVDDGWNAGDRDGSVVGGRTLLRWRLVTRPADPRQPAEDEPQAGGLGMSDEEVAERYPLAAEVGRLRAQLAHEREQHATTMASLQATCEAREEDRAQHAAAEEALAAAGYSVVSLAAAIRALADERDGWKSDAEVYRATINDIGHAVMDHAKTWTDAAIVEEVRRLKREAANPNALLSALEKSIHSLARNCPEGWTTIDRLECSIRPELVHMRRRACDVADALGVPRDTDLGDMAGEVDGIVEANRDLLREREAVARLVLRVVGVATVHDAASGRHSPKILVRVQRAATEGPDALAALAEEG